MGKWIESVEINETELQGNLRDGKSMIAETLVLPERKEPILDSRSRTSAGNYKNQNIDELITVRKVQQSKIRKYRDTLRDKVMLYLAQPTSESRAEAEEWIREKEKYEYDPNMVISSDIVRNYLRELDKEIEDLKFYINGYSKYAYQGVGKQSAKYTDAKKYSNHAGYGIYARDDEVEDKHRRNLVEEETRNSASQE